MTARLRRAALLGPLLLALAACQGRAPSDASSQAGFDGPGLTGRLHLAVASGLAEVAHAQADRFERQYPGAALVATPMTAREALAALQAGAADAAVIDRAPTDDERAALAAAGRAPAETLLGADAVAVVAASGSSVRAVSVADLRGAARGDGPFRLATASRNVGATGAAAVALGVEAPRAVQLPTEADVVGYVATHPEVVGLVSYGSLPLAVGPAVRVVAVDGVQPTPRAVFEGDYPLVEPVVLLTVAGSGDARVLAAGFARFAASAVGQEAVLRAGLAPATLPQREVVLS